MSQPDVASPEVANYVSTAAAGIGIAIGALITYLKKPRKAEDQVAVISATFSDRQTIDRLSTALDSNTACLKRNNELLEAENHRREVDAEVRDILRSRGVTP